jgi:hypothetical protein
MEDKPTGFVPKWVNAINKYLKGKERDPSLSTLPYGQVGQN